MLYVLDNLARKNEAGATLPTFIRAKMEAKGWSPTVRELGRRLNRSGTALSRNFAGQNEMSLTHAKQLADLLDITLDELVHNCSGLVHG